MDSDYWREGYDAFERGDHLDDCPLSGDKRVEWELGWKAALQYANWELS